MTQTVNNRFIEIGRIGRPRGLEGLVRFMPNDIFTADLFDQVSVFYIKNQRSDLIPTRVESIRVEKKRNQQTFFVKFDTIANREEAEAAMNRALYADREVTDVATKPEEDKDDLFGYTVIFDGEKVGKVLDVIHNPAHPILEIKFGSVSLLIPYVNEFVDHVDHDKATVYCKNLDQLTDF